MAKIAVASLVASLLLHGSTAAASEGGPRFLRRPSLASSSSSNAGPVIDTASFYNEEFAMSRPNYKSSHVERITLDDTSTTDTQDDFYSTRSLQECSLDISGNYGLIQGIPRFITFHYQAVLFPGTSMERVEIEILPDLERAITTGILPDLFSCPTTNRKSGGLIDGISTSLEDLIVSDELECIVTSCPTCPCITFQGRMVVFSTSITTQSAAREVIEPLVDRYMQLNEVEVRAVDPRIISIYPVMIVNGVVNTPPPVDVSTSPSSMPSLEPTLAPTAAPTVASTTTAPTTSSTSMPTSAPIATRENPLPTSAPSVPFNATARNVDDDDDDGLLGFAWWIWVLFGVGALVICVCFVANCTNFDGSKRSRVGGGSVASSKKKRRKKAERNPYGDSEDNTDDAYEPPGGGGASTDDGYVPPGLGVNLEPVIPPSKNAAAPVTVPDKTSKSEPGLGEFDVQNDFVPSGEYAESDEDEEEEESYDEEQTYNEEDEEYDDYDDEAEENDYEEGTEDYEDPTEDYDDDEDGEEYDEGTEQFGDEGEEDDDDYSEYDEETLEHAGDDEEKVAATWGQSYVTASSGNSY